MIADESLVTLKGLKKYDQTKGTAVIEANELPATPLNKVYNVGDDVYSKDVKLSTYQQMIDEVDKVKVDDNTQDANRNIISKAVIEQANIPLAPLDKVYNVGGSPIELTASGTCTQETSPGGTETIETGGSGLYIGDCFINHLPARSSFKLKSSIDNVWHTVSYPLPENGTFIYGTSLSEESCLVIQTNDNKLRVITIDETQNQAFTINYEEETSTRVFSKSIELITKDSAEPKTFKGTTTEWNNLTPAEQAAFEVKYITDDVPVIPDYIKVKHYLITDITQPSGNDLTSHTTAVLDSGYKFLAYVSVASDGWVTPNPIYVSTPWNIEGSLWTRSDNPVPSTGSLVVTFLEIKE